MPVNCNYYWPYAIGEPIVRYEYVYHIDKTLPMTDGNYFHFGDVETYTDTVNNIVSMIFYFCSNAPHSHPDQPSCCRFVMSFLSET